MKYLYSNNPKFAANKLIVCCWQNFVCLPEYVCKGVSAIAQYENKARLFCSIKIFIFNHFHNTSTGWKYNHLTK